MEINPRNLGRAYLIDELRKRGLSRRGAKRILNFIFAEMSRALAEGEPVEFPFGYLKRREKDSPFFKWDGDPLQPYTVQHVLDEEGDWLLNPAGWSSRPPKTPLPRWTKPRRPRGRPKKTPAAETALSR